MIEARDVLAELEKKFQANFARFIEEVQGSHQKIQLKARAIAALGQIASEDGKLQPNQFGIIPMFDEVFADMVISIYLTACALDNPAQAALRRALELGVAIVYLWDLPHILWGWKEHDLDLNFNEMLEHLAKPAYKSFLTSLNAKYTGEDLFDYNEARRLYRLLSNTVHGKISTHESNLPDKFSFSLKDCHNSLDLIDRVQAILLALFRSRFQNYFSILESKIPAVNILTQEQRK
jgi:hypothetical protein